MVVLGIHQRMRDFTYSILGTLFYWLVGRVARDILHGRPDLLPLLQRLPSLLPGGLGRVGPGMRRQEALLRAAERQQRILIAQLAIANQYDIFGQQLGCPQRGHICQVHTIIALVAIPGPIPQRQPFGGNQTQHKLDIVRFAILIVTLDQQGRMLVLLRYAGFIFIAPFEIHTGCIAVQPFQIRLEFTHRIADDRAPNGDLLRRQPFQHGSQTVIIQPKC